MTDPSVKGYMQGYIAAALHIITSVMAYGEDKEQICKMMEIAPEDYDRLYYFSNLWMKNNVGFCRKKNFF